jgi:hypothetical protein
MPLWRIYANPSTFAPEQRAGISEAITQQYVSRGLPAFYVVVIFLDAGAGTTYVGGNEKRNFVRIVVEQIARTMPSDSDEEGKKYRRRWMDIINKVRSS